MTLVLSFIPLRSRALWRCPPLRANNFSPGHSNSLLSFTPSTFACMLRWKPNPNPNNDARSAEQPFLVFPTLLNLPPPSTITSIAISPTTYHMGHQLWPAISPCAAAILLLLWSRFHTVSNPACCHLYVPSHVPVFLLPGCHLYHGHLLTHFGQNLFRNQWQTPVRAD